MQQTQIDQDVPWKDLNTPTKIIEEDIIQKFLRIGPTAFPHQAEFIRYMLGQKDQAPVIMLRSLTGSGKTLCFQSIIYQNYKEQIHKAYEIERTGKDGKARRVVLPYAVILGNTIFLKQHEEAFLDLLPQRLQDQGMKFQTFFAFSKDSVNIQFHTAENRIEEAQANVLFCHPSKLTLGVKKGFIGLKNLRYLVIDEADQLLSDDPNNRVKADVALILQFLITQRDNKDFQILFVSASLQVKQIESFLAGVINDSLEDKQVDRRFFVQEGPTKKPLVTVQSLPTIAPTKIASFSIRHFYVESSDEEAGQAKSLADILYKVYQAFDQTQTMVFFNTKVETKAIFDQLQKNPELEFLVKDNQIVTCTGDDNQVVREEVRKQFKDTKKLLLLCTDVLQRGLDFRQVRLIIHFGVPATGSDSKFLPEVYYQRSGRTGRAKDEGVVLTIVGKADRQRKPSLKETMFNKLKEDGTDLVEFKEDNFYEEMKKVLTFEKERKQK